MAIPLDRLITVLAIVAFVALESWLAARTGRRTPATMAAIVGLVAARIVYVVQHLASYSQDPWSSVAVWQGGFSSWAGVSAAGIVLAFTGKGWRERWPALIVLATTFALWSVATGYLRERDVRPMPAGVVLTTLDGRPMALEQLRGRPFVINLWASWCGPCRREMPMLAAAAKARGDVPILFVNEGETLAVVRTFLAREGLAPPNMLLDPEQRAGRILAFGVLPTTLFVSSEGVIRERHVGEISRAGLDESTDDLRE
jgi:cytochrome c biogenesis protein CcmG/thiol:disulfide interchange protein DsbE